MTFVNVSECCDLCGGTRFEPWAEDHAMAMCSGCKHVCGHIPPGSGIRPSELTDEEKTAAYIAAHPRPVNTRRWPALSWYRSWDWRNFQRPHLRRYWADYDEAIWSLEWSEGNCDPAWEIAVTIRLPRWIGRWFD